MFKKASGSSFSFTQINAGIVQLVLIIGLFALLESKLSAQSTGLVGHWSFDDPFNPVMDRSGFGNDGVNHGATWTPAGAVGGAMTFDGLSDHIEIANSPSLALSGPVTFSTWVNADPSQYFRVGLIQKRPGTEPGEGFQLVLFSGIAYLGLANTTTGGTVTSTSYVTDNQWHHIAGTYDGSEVKMYVDGELENTLHYTGGYQANASSLLISMYRYAYNDGHGNLAGSLNGSMDEVMIWNRALSETEIRENAGVVSNKPPTVSCPDPVSSECNGPSTRDVTLSVDIADPDHDLLDVVWYVNGQLVQSTTETLAATDSLTYTYDLGTSEVTVVVDDGTADPVSCSTMVMIIDRQDPVAIVGPEVTIDTDPGECFSSNVVLMAPQVSDNCEVAFVTNNAPQNYPLGTTTVTWTVTDTAGNFTTVDQDVTVEDNERPTITSPPDITVSHDIGQCDALVSLGIPTTSDNCSVASVTNNAPAGNLFPVGTTEIVWTVTDSSGNRAYSMQSVNVTNTNPVAHAGADRIVECNNVSGNGTAVSLDGTASFDFDEGDILNYQWSAVDITFDDSTSPTPTADFPKGSTTVSLIVEDQCGAIGSADVIIVVEDTTAPQIQAAIVDRQALWPPSHDMIPVALDLVVRDTCDSPEELVLLCEVSSDEPDDNLGDGAFTGDVNGSDGYTSPVPITLTYNFQTGRWEGNLELRAERDGKENGRRYSIKCAAFDQSGNFSTSTATVTVFHNKAK